MISIKDITEELNISSRAIRYYEKYFDLKSVKKSNVRYFNEEDFKVIKIIATFRKLNFSLLSILEFLKNYDKNSLLEIIEKEKKQRIFQIDELSKEILLLVDLNKTINNSYDLTTDELIINKLFDDYKEGKNEYLKDKKSKRINVIIKFFELIKANQFLEFERYCENINLKYIKDRLIDKIKLEEELVSYKIHSQYSLYNQSIIVEIIGKNYNLDLNFVFNEEDKVIGIWNIRFVQKKA